MNAAYLLFSLWWLAMVGVFGFLTKSAFNNKFMIGIRAYPRAEHRRRFEQWMLLPLIGLFTSVATGLATGLIITGGWGTLLGLSALSGTFFITVNLGLWFGLLRRDQLLPTWETDTSLEAMHAEVAGSHVGDGLPEDLQTLFTERLELMRLEMSEEEGGGRDRAPFRGLSWGDCPRGGIGAIRLSNGVKLRIPMTQVATFMKRRIWLLVVTGVSVTAAILWFLWLPFGVVTILCAAAMIIVPVVLAFKASRAELIYRSRSQLERAEMIQEALVALERSRAADRNTVSDDASQRHAMKGRRVWRAPKGRTRRLAGQTRHRTLSSQP